MRQIMIFTSMFLLIGLKAAPAAAQDCKVVVRDAAFKIYKEECEGYGSRNDCEIAVDPASDGSTMKATCFYSGEPDYSDSLEAEFVVDAQCHIVKTTVTSCYSD